MDDEGTTYDSLALHVAVMPCINTLPIYYAERMGLADSVGLRIQVMHYTAQMDIDTAVLRGHADLFVTDTIRYGRLAKQTAMQPIMLCSEPLSIIAHRNTRATKLKQMKDKMVSACRLCATSAWCDAALDSVGLDKFDTFRPQVNDVTLRYDMLCNELIDAAVLPEPFASAAVLQGHRRLAQTSKRQYATAVWAMPDNVANNATRIQQAEQFATMYQRAVHEMNAGANPDIVRDILTSDYAIPSSVVDSLTLPRLSPAILNR